MARPSVNERVYAAIKAQMLAGAFRPGARLDVAALAKAHAASQTPVHGALNQLVGERLLEKHGKDGFFLPRITEHSLRALYSWVWSLLRLALAAPAAGRGPPDPRIAADIGELETADPIDDVERLFLRIGALTGNIEMHWALQSAQARLRSVRRLEGELIDPEDAGAELRAMTVALLREDRDRLEEALETYFQRRLDAAADLVVLAIHAREPAE